MDNDFPSTSKKPFNALQRPKEACDSLRAASVMSLTLFLIVLGAKTPFFGHSEKRKSIDQFLVFWLNCRSPGLGRHHRQIMRPHCDRICQHLQAASRFLLQDRNSEKSITVGLSIQLFVIYRLAEDVQRLYDTRRRESVDFYGSALLKNQLFA